MNKNLKEVTQLFLKLGGIAFGGPAVHIEMMEKLKWLERKNE